MPLYGLNLNIWLRRAAVQGIAGDRVLFGTCSGIPLIKRCCGVCVTVGGGKQKWRSVTVV